MSRASAILLAALLLARLELLLLPHKYPGITRRGRNVVQWPRLDGDLRRGAFRDRVVSGLDRYRIRVNARLRPCGKAAMVVHLPRLFGRPEGEGEARDGVVKLVQGFN